MFNIDYRHRLFLVLFIFPYFFLGCSDKDNSSSNSASWIQIPKPKPDPKPDPDPKPKPHPKPKPEPLATSTLMITASQTNAMLQPFIRFNLGLVNIKFTVIPEGKDKAIDVFLYQPSDNTEGAEESRDIDLTSLQNNQYMLIDTMAIPTGTIIGTTISFSGANSHIELTMDDSSLILIDPFFSGYSAHGGRISKIRKTPAELFIKTHIKLTKDKFEYINLNIDETLTANPDIYVLPEEPAKQLPYQSYLQFTPTVTLNTLPKNTAVSLVIINEKPLAPDNTQEQINTMMLNATPVPFNLSAVSDANRLTDLTDVNDKNYALLITTLSTHDMPSLTLNTIALNTTIEQRRMLMASLNSQYLAKLPRSNKIFLHYRDTFNEQVRANRFPDYRFKVLTPIQSDESGVVFRLPQETYLIDYIKKDDQYRKFSITNWLCNEILYFTDWSAAPPTCHIDTVDTLRLPMDDTTAGNFIILETGRMDLDTLTILPDIIHQFTSSKAFYRLLKDKLAYEYPHIAGLEIEGEFNNNEFTVTKGMKVILLSQHNSKLKAILDIMIGQLGSVAILSEWLHGKRSNKGHQRQSHTSAETWN